MRSLFNDLLTFAELHITIATAALGVVLAGLTTYLRQQVRGAIAWALSPLTKRFPWNRPGSSLSQEADEPDLVAELSIVDVFILASDGTKAKYQKTSHYVAMRNGLSSYHEGVTSAGNAASFTTWRGLIVSTVREHGFFVSMIDLGGLLPKGSRFTNIFSAELEDCFTSRHEHWTQEIAVPTNRLILQIHFANDRTPRLVKCKRVVGLLDKQVATTAVVLDTLVGKSIVWDLEAPQMKDIYKLEWVW